MGSDEANYLLTQIAQRQLELREFIDAAGSFLAVRRPADSICALLEGHDWEQAKQVCFR